MRKKIIAIITGAGVMLTLTSAFAVDTAPMNLSTPGTERTLVLPMSAGNAPVISLGTGVDPETGSVVEGIAIIHYKKGFGHRPGHPNEAKPGGSNSCFAYLSRGTRWLSAEPWVVNPVNTRGLNHAFVFENLSADLSKWEDASDGSVNGVNGAEIFGSGTLTFDTLVAETSSPDGVNEAYFADISNSGAIAVTIVWGVFSGPSFNRKIVEWDMIVDDVDFDWSETGEFGKMDYENIITHEVGHAAGMGHPDISCADETMYRYADYGETKKRDLHTGDINGINQLY